MQDREEESHIFCIKVQTGVVCSKGSQKTIAREEGRFGAPKGKISEMSGSLCSGREICLDRESILMLWRRDIIRKKKANMFLKFGRLSNQDLHGGGSVKNVGNTG